MIANLQHIANLSYACKWSKKQTYRKAEKIENIMNRLKAKGKKDQNTN